DQDLLIDVDVRGKREVAELLQAFLGAVEDTVRIRQKHAMLEAEVDVLPLRADPGERSPAASIGEAVADPAPAAPDPLDGIGHGDPDQLPQAKSRIADGGREVLEEHLDRELVDHGVILRPDLVTSRQEWQSAGDLRLSMDLRRPNSHDQLAFDAVPLAELLRSVGAHVLRAEQGRDIAALGQVVDEAGLALDGRVPIRRLRILGEPGDGATGP